MSDWVVMGLKKLGLHANVLKTSLGKDREDELRAVLEKA